MGLPAGRIVPGRSNLSKATAGSGHRARYAATTELKLPVLKMHVAQSERTPPLATTYTGLDDQPYNAEKLQPVRSQLLFGDNV